MALTPKPRINFPSGEPWKFSDPAPVTVLPGVAEADHLGSWIFGRADPDDAVTRSVCKRNRAPLARNAEGDYQIFGTPVIHDDYWEFPGGLASLRTSLFLPAQFCGYAIAWSNTANIGSTSLLRAAIVSSFENSGSLGFTLALWNSVLVRGFGYGPIATPALKQVDLTTPGVTVPRIYYFERQPTGGANNEWRVRVINISEDSDTDEVEIIWEGGPSADKLPIWIGSSPSVNYGATTKLHRLELIAGAGHNLATRQAIADAVLRGHMERNTALEELTEAA